jgi:adenylosuccinate synthase
VQLRYAIMVNGVTELSMMKSDVLGIFEHINVCTHYLINGEKVTDFPYDVTDMQIEPIYEQLEGWHCDLTELEDFAAAPAALKDYVTYLEAQLNVPIRVISVGPDRKQTLQN